MASSGASPTLLTIKQAMAELQVSRTTLWKWIKSGDLPSVRLTKDAVRIRRTDLEAFIARRQVEPER